MPLLQPVVKKMAKHQVKIGGFESQTQGFALLLHAFLKIFSINFAEKSIGQHTPRQRRELKLQELQGCTDILPLVNLALYYV